MATINHIAFGILILQLYVNAAPSDISKLEDIAEVDEANIKLDSKPHVIAQEKTTDDNSTQSARQKRFYNYYGYGFPPVSPLIYPNNVKRDQSSNTAVYGAEDPFVQIHRRLQEIANVARQPVPPPLPSHVPLFFPVIFIPQVGCGCFPETNNNSSQNPAGDKTDTNPDVNTRFPEMNDIRQNWGFVVNDTDIDDEEEFSRPISFDPISVNRPLSRPPPPIDHGSSQGNTQTQTTTTTTTTQPAASPALIPVSNSNELSDPLEPPTNCDGAVLSCCHQLQVTYDCFALQGCPDPTSYGNPCDPNVILKVIDRYQRFYGQRKG